MTRITALLTLLALSSAALADVAPEPGQLERGMVTRIRNSGFDCPDPVKLEPATTRELAMAASRHVGARRVHCGNGRRYVVSTGLRPRTGDPQHFVLPAE